MPDELIIDIASAEQPASDATPRTEPHQQRGRGKLDVRHALAVISAPSPIEIIEGIAAAGCITLVVGESGAGKSFLLDEFAATVSAGTSCFDRLTAQGSLLTVQCEADNQGLRYRALVERKGYALDHVYVVRLREPLSRRGDDRAVGEIALVKAIQSLAADLREKDHPPIRAIEVDTVRASMSGSEDSSEDVSNYLRAVQRIASAAPGAAIILSHHAGWQDGETPRKRERGSSAWRGNVDYTLYLESGPYDDQTGEAELTLRTLKVRDGERPVPLHLIRRRVEITGRDQRGNLLTSCVIDRDHRTRHDREQEARVAVEQAHALIDQRILRTIVEQPALATSQDTLRLALGVRKTVVAESLSRLVQTGFVVPGGRGKPYTVTPSGLSAMEPSR